MLRCLQLAQLTPHLHAVAKVGSTASSDARSVGRVGAADPLRGVPSADARDPSADGDAAPASATGESEPGMAQNRRSL